MNYLSLMLGANRVSKFNVTDANPTLEDVVTGLDNPAGIQAVGTILLVTEFANNGSVVRIDTSEATPTAVEIVTGQNNPFGVSFFNDDLYFIQNGAGTLSRFQGNVLATEDVSILNNITVFPNPSQGQFSIAGLQGQVINEATLIDLTGRVIKRFNSQDTSLNTFDFPATSGTYFVSIQTDSGNITKQIIIQ